MAHRLFQRGFRLFGRSARVVTVCLVALLIGCEDIDWTWWQGTGQRRPPSQRRVVGRAAPFTAARTGPSVPADLNPSSTRPPGPEAAPQEAGSGFFQLLLLNEPASAAAPSNIRQINLRQGRAWEVGQLVEALYAPAGPGGSEQRYFLVYESPQVWSAAADMAVQLDVPAVAAESVAPPAGPGAAFEHAVGRFYSLLRSAARTPEQTGELVDSLNRLSVSRALDEPSRWAAAMTAGHVCANWRNDSEAARRFYLLATQRALPGSPEEMMAYAKLAEAHAGAGDLNAARQAYLELLSRSAQLSGDYVYKQAHLQALAVEERVSGKGSPQKQ